MLFLDEVSEMSPTAQAKFLRFLQEREFTRLGGTRVQKANVRVVAASNRNLREAVARGTFREDLFYRLQVFDIQLPPLRERISDVPLIAEQFLEELGQTMGRRPARLGEDAREALLGYNWPGNVRELRNVLERAAIMSDEGVIERRHLSIDSKPAAAAAPHDLGAIERQTIESVLRQTDWNKAKTARQLGLSRTQLYVRLPSTVSRMLSRCRRACRRGARIVALVAVGLWLASRGAAAQSVLRAIEARWRPVDRTRRDHMPETVSLISSPSFQSRSASSGLVQDMSLGRAGAVRTFPSRAQTSIARWGCGDSGCRDFCSF